METLSAFLGITEMPDKEPEDQSLRLPETWDWFLEREGFQEWRDVDSSKTLWVSDRPGQGKACSRPISFIACETRDPTVALISL